ncbi:MAG: lysophospholipid acyltransferase family protein [Planctomycetota bacterium]
MKDWEYRPAADAALKSADRLVSPTREIGLPGALALDALALGARVWFTLYHRLSIGGLENVPRSGPLVIAANHASHFDAPLLLSCLPSSLRPTLYPVAASDTFFVSPPRSALATGFINALPIRRGRACREALGALRDRLIGEPCTLIVFPEGTRSRTGQASRLRDGIGALVAGADVPVVPCRIDGTHQALPPGVRLPRAVKIGVTFKAPINFSDVSDDREGWRSVAEALEPVLCSGGER